MASIVPHQYLERLLYFVAGELWYPSYGVDPFLLFFAMINLVKEPVFLLGAAPTVTRKLSSKRQPPLLPP